MITNAHNHPTQKSRVGSGRVGSWCSILSGQPTTTSSIHLQLLISNLSHHSSHFTILTHLNLLPNMLLHLHFHTKLNASTFFHSYGQSFFLLLLFFAVLIFVPSFFFCIHFCRRWFSHHGRSTPTTVVCPLPDLQWVGIELTNNIMVGFEKQECCICLSLFQGNEKLKMLIECEHVFHSECLNLWLTAHPTCPLCRASLHVRQSLHK